MGTADDTARLRELAQAATPGPWWSDEFMAIMPGEPVVGDRPMPPEIALVSPMRGSRAEQRANAAYIAAVDPRTILALLDRAELGDALREALTEAQAGLGSVLFLADNIHNAGAAPIQFRQFFDAATEDVRRAYDAAAAALTAAKEPGR